MKINRKHLKIGGATIGLIAVVLLLLALFFDELYHSQTNKKIGESKILPLQEAASQETMRKVGLPVSDAGENAEESVPVKTVFGFKSVKKGNFSRNYSDFDDKPAKELMKRGIVWMVLCFLCLITASLGIIGSMAMPGKEKIMSGLLTLSSWFLIGAVCTIEMLSSNFAAYTMKMGVSLIMAAIDVFILLISGVMVFLSSGACQKGHVAVS